MRVSMDSDGLQSTRQTLFGPRPGEWAEWVDPAVPGPRGVKRWLGVLGLVVDSDDGAALLFSLSLPVFLSPCHSHSALLHSFDSPSSLRLSEALLFITSFSHCICIG
jgi:hypothetical protein